MAYEVSMLYHLHMPSWFLGTFTEYPYIDILFIEVFSIHYFLYILLQALENLLAELLSSRIEIQTDFLDLFFENAFIYITVEIHIVIKPESDIEIFFLVGQITVYKSP